MKVILLQDVKNVGKKDQIVEVSDGYAKNFLFPRKLAVQETSKSKEILENQKENARLHEEELKKEALELKEKLKDITLEFSLNCGKDDKVFGNVSSKQIEEALSALHGISIDKRKFIDKTAVDTLGYHRLKIELYKGVVAEINVHTTRKD